MTSYFSAILVLAFTVLNAVLFVTIGGVWNLAAAVFCGGCFLYIIATAGDA